MSIIGNYYGVLAYYKHSRGDYSAAEALYEKAVKRGLNNAERLGAYAVLVMRKGEFERSIKMFSKLLLARPKPDIRLRVRLNRAIAFTKTERFEEAKAALEDIHKVWRSKRVYQALGYLYILINDTKTERYNLEAYDYDPSDVVILDNLAQHYINKNNFIDARKFAQKAFDEEQDKVDVLYHLAIIEHHDKNSDKAKEYAEMMMTANLTPLNDVTNDILLKTYRKITDLDWEIKKIHSQTEEEILKE